MYLHIAFQPLVREGNDFYLEMSNGKEFQCVINLSVYQLIGGLPRQVVLHSRPILTDKVVHRRLHSAHSCNVYFYSMRPLHI